MCANEFKPIKYFCTPNIQGYNVKFSPFTDKKFAIAASENFGIKGCGALLLYDGTSPSDVPFQKLIWKDALFDLSWSEDSPTVLLTSAGDGSVQIWDFNAAQNPADVLQGHSLECSSVVWSMNKNLSHFATTSWDKSVLMWDFVQRTVLTKLLAHQSIVYQAAWSPLVPNCLASVAGDGKMFIWNPQQRPTPCLGVHCSNAEVLCCDWSKYDQNLVITGSTDAVVRGWDLRKPNQHVFQLIGHESPVTKVKTSPFEAAQIASASYDFTTRIWDMYGFPATVLQTHSEFVYGVDFSRQTPGLLLDCGWDHKATLYRDTTLVTTTRI